MADQVGRRSVLFLAILGSLVQDVMSKIILWRPDVFPPRLTWLSSAGTLIGGGDAIASAMIFLIVTDVAPAQERANLFFLLSACGLAAEVVATPLTALLMKKSPWIPYFVYTSLTVMGSLIPVFLIPETLPMATPEELSTTTTSEEDEEEDESAAISMQTTIISKFRPLLTRNIVAVLLAFFVSSLGRQSTSFLLQYIQQRFNWTYQKASFFIILRASINLAVLLVGLPVFNKVLVKGKISTPGKDLLISRLSVAFFAIGSLVIATAPVAPVMALGIVIFALGYGFPAAARSLVTTFCQQEQAGTLYSALAITQLAGGLVAGPLLEAIL